MTSVQELPLSKNYSEQELPLLRNFSFQELSLYKNYLGQEWPLKHKYNDYIILTRPDTASLSFIAFAKKDGEQGWTKLDDTKTIDPASLRDTGNVNTNLRIVPTSAASHGQATGGAHGGGDTHEEQLEY